MGFPFHTKISIMKYSMLSFLILAMFAFSSCEKGDEIKDWDKDNLKETDDKNYDDKGEKVCFDLVYPVTYLMPDGSEITGDNEEEIDEAIKAWYEANPSDEKPELQYPVDVDWGDHGTFTVNDDEEMWEHKKKCNDEKWDKEPCFSLIYPVTYVMPDGSEITGNDEEELWTAIKTWYEANPNDEKPELQYPVQIAYPDSDVPVTINSDEEMIEVKEECEDDGN